MVVEGEVLLLEVEDVEEREACCCVRGAGARGATEGAWKTG